MVVRTVAVGGELNLRPHSLSFWVKSLSSSNFYASPPQAKQSFSASQTPSSGPQPLPHCVSYFQVYKDFSKRRDTVPAARSCLTVCWLSCSDSTRLSSACPGFISSCWTVISSIHWIRALWHCR